MKKKVTDLSQALAVGLPDYKVITLLAAQNLDGAVGNHLVGIHVRGRPRPALGRPRSSGVEERGEGCSVRSVSRSTPLKVRIQPDCPPA